MSITLDLLCKLLAAAFCTRAGQFGLERGISRVEKGPYAALRLGFHEMAAIVFTPGRVGEDGRRRIETPGLTEMVESSGHTATREALGIFEVNRMATWLRS